MTNTLIGHDVEEGELPSGWEIRDLRDVATLSLGKMLDKKQQTGLHPTPYLRNINVRWGNVDLGDVQSMDITPGQIDRVSLGNGDLVVCEGGEPGRAAVWTENETFAIQKALHRVRPVPGLNPAYLYFIFENEFRGVGDHPLFTGTTIKHLPKEKISLVRVPMPSLAEQERIVEILEDQLSRLDTALQSVRTVREKAAQFRRSLLHAAFTGTLTGHDVQQGELPEGWELRPLSDLGEVRLGRQRSPKNHSGPQMRPYLRAANVSWAGLSLDDVAEMNFSDEEMETYLLEPGDILVNEASGSPSEVGKAAVFRGEIDGCAFQNTLIRVRANATGGEFLHQFLSFLAISGAYVRESRGVGIFHLGKMKLAAWPVTVPPLEEQDRIVEILEDQLTRLDAALAVADAVEERSAALRRSLLHSAFTGRLTREWREAVNV